MKPTHKFFSLLLLSGSLVAQSQEQSPTLSITAVGPALEFTVTGPQGPFLGAAILSLSPAVSHYFQGLPPILSDFVVLGVGIAKLEYSVQVLEYHLPPGILIYAQGIVADGISVQSTAVAKFVLDASFPDQR